MANKHLATYLNDHLAGSITGLELLEYIASAYAGTEAERVARALHVEVAEDRRELEQLMARLGIGQSVPRKASAWLAEKFSQIKLRMDDLAAVRSGCTRQPRPYRSASKASGCCGAPWPPHPIPTRRCAAATTRT